MRDTKEQIWELLDAGEQVLRLREMFIQSPSFSALLQGPDHRFVLTNPAYQQLIGHRNVIGMLVICRARFARRWHSCCRFDHGTAACAPGQLVDTVHHLRWRAKGGQGWWWMVGDQSRSRSIFWVLPTPSRGCDPISGRAHRRRQIVSPCSARPGCEGYPMAGFWGKLRPLGGLGLTHLGHRRRYSITSSAATSSVVGTSRPSAFAAFRLTTISNLVDC